MWKNRDKIFGAFEENESRIKRLRKPERSNVDKKLLKWFNQQRSENVAVGGRHAVKAEELAKVQSWLDRQVNRGLWTVKRQRNGLINVWPELREGYLDTDVISADKTRLFFRLTPERTLKFKEENACENRVTVLVCANGRDRKEDVVCNWKVRKKLDD
jgi:hypothetical protein